MFNRLKRLGILLLAGFAPMAQTLSAPSIDTPQPLVFIIHGYAATPRDHWFAWLAQALAERGIEARRIALPNPTAPDPQAWGDRLDSRVFDPDRPVYFVAHSLGGIALLASLQRGIDANPAAQWQGMVLVSAFAQPLSDLAQLDAFVEAPIDFDAIRTHVDRALVISARDDPIVPFAFSMALAERLQAPFRLEPVGGHFLGRDGYTRLPVVLTTLLDMMGARGQLPAGGRCP